MRFKFFFIFLIFFLIFLYFLKKKFPNTLLSIKNFITKF
jgi:hypothetical protein